MQTADDGSLCITVNWLYIIHRLSTTCVCFSFTIFHRQHTASHCQSQMTREFMAQQHVRCQLMHASPLPDSTQVTSWHRFVTKQLVIWTIIAKTLAIRTKQCDMRDETVMYSTIMKSTSIAEKSLTFMMLVFPSKVLKCNANTNCYCRRRVSIPRIWVCRILKIFCGRRWKLER